MTNVCDFCAARSRDCSYGLLFGSQSCVDTKARYFLNRLIKTGDNIKQCENMPFEIKKMTDNLSYMIDDIKITIDNLSQVCNVGNFSINSSNNIFDGISLEQKKRIEALIKSVIHHRENKKRAENDEVLKISSVNKILLIEAIQKEIDFLLMLIGLEIFNFMNSVKNVDMSNVKNDEWEIVTDLDEKIQPYWEFCTEIESWKKCDDYFESWEKGFKVKDFPRFKFRKLVIKKSLMKW